MGGTCTGEHGIGQGKQKYLTAELGPEAIEAMRALKQALDPQNIFNPERYCRRCSACTHRALSQKPRRCKCRIRNWYDSVAIRSVDRLPRLKRLFRRSGSF